MNLLEPYITLCFAGWCGNRRLRFPFRPIPSNATFQRMVSDRTPGITRPFDQCFGVPECRNKDVAPGVSLLGRRRYPKAIARFVVAVNLSAFDGQIVGITAGNCPSEKRLEIIHPLRAHNDTPATIIVKRFFGFVIASCLHVFPRLMEPGSGLTMGSETSPGDFVFPATTTRRMAACQFIADLPNRFPALAKAFQINPRPPHFTFARQCHPAIDGPGDHGISPLFHVFDFGGFHYMSHILPRHCPTKRGAF